MIKQRKFFTVSRHLRAADKMYSFLLLSSALALSQVAHAEILQRIQLEKKVNKLESTIKTISDQTGYDFIYLSDHAKSIDVKPQQTHYPNIETALSDILKGTSLRYKIESQTVILERVTDASARQQQEVRGKVLGADGQPLASAVVRLDGSSSETSTNTSGDFVLKVPEIKGTISITYLGYQTLRLPAKADIGRVQLLTGVSVMDEVVVVGMGSQKRNTITSAISTIKKEDIESRPVTDLTSVLQGNVAGLNFSTDATSGNAVGGEIGAPISFNIRGIGSINGGEPYVLVDGVEQSLQNVNPADVESITVLKDASASAVYGARAAYGVVLITTKSGRAEKARLSYQGTVGFNSPINLPEMMSSVEFARYINQRNDNMGVKPIFTDATIEKMEQFLANPYGTGLPGLGLNTDGSDWASAYDNQYANTDWFDYYFKDVSRLHIHNLNITGGSDKINYYVGTGFVDQQGLLNSVTDKMKKYNLNSKLEIRAREWLKFNFNNNLSYNAIDRPMPNQTIFYGTIGNAYPNRPTHLPVSSSYNLPNWNEMMFLKEAFYKQSRISDALSLSGTITPVKNWDIIGDMKVRFDVENNNFTLKRPQYEQPTGAFLVTQGNKQGYHYPGMTWQNTQFGSYTRGSAFNYYLSPNLSSSYQSRIGEHFFKIMGGFQAEVQNYSSEYMYKDNMMSEGIYSFDNANGQIFGDEARSHWSTMGTFARLNWHYQDTYFVEMSGRYDGSSRFAPGHRWGLFPSVSLGYDMAKADYFQKLNLPVSQLKLRLSYGRLGNQNGAGLYDYISSMNLVADHANAWLLPGATATPSRGTIALTPNMVSPYITWEKVDNANLGIDLSAFDSRLTLTADVYERTTRDMIGPAEAIPLLSGIAIESRSKVNNATLRNRGWELSVNWAEKLKSGFSYGLGFNLFDYKAIVTRYNNPEGVIFNNHTGLTRNKGYYEGMDIGEVWGYRADDLFMSNRDIDAYLSQVDLSFFKGNNNWQMGDLKYLDLNGDGKVNPGKGTLSDHGDLAIIGNATPRYSFGVNLKLGYKGFEISAFLQGVAKRDFPMAGSTYLFGGRNFFKEHLDYFSYDNPGGYLPRLSDPVQTDYQVNTGYNTSRYLLDASYLRMKNLMVSYSFANESIKKLGISNLRIYATSDNLFTISSLPGQFDPETINQVNTWAGGSNAAAPGLTSVLLQNGNGKVYPLNKNIVLGLNLNF
ncbi:TonB-linked outer membrane protein, SusC/RagA family [Sphingobacterium nematocida]|uniref:TonB-linked outer membrane protein, SusC/RagA family n=1 Tax=Sphingobacterium nematocida TaxID=1513896 RepID=A0A1T5DEN0_9SPHI|nr:SusC/RagA family TonB-linked outer membrane protein [Sphingobacterium nematocida]SKB70061.1 TonB-linked outer membrane protein, SusC/RagA family [Sphingobacterium nematocida]